MGVEAKAKLALQFTCFNPEILAKLETQALFKDMSGKHASAFQLQTAMVVHQFGLSETAAKKVVKHLRPDKNQPPFGDLLGYFAQLSYETGLGFSVNPDFLSVPEPMLASLAGIFSAVYEVKPEKLYPAMQARIAAMKCLDGRNVPAVARLYYHENLVQYYTLLKAAIS